MTSQCDNCDCADKSQCPYKDAEMLDEIVVTENPNEDEQKDYDESYPIDDSQDWSITGGNEENKDEKCAASWSLPSMPDELSSVSAANEEIAKRLSKELEELAKDKLAKFNQENPRSYKQAKAIFERQMRQEWKKLKPAQIAAVNEALDIDEFNRLAQETKTFSAFFKGVNRASDVVNVANAYKYGIEHDDWTKLFDTSTALGINASIAWGLGFLPFVSFPAIISIGLIIGGISYFVNEDLIRELREDYFSDLDKYLKNNQTETNCK